MAVCRAVAAYQGHPKADVLDDGPSDEARDLAASLGLDYIRRPGQRVHKKSVNLRCLCQTTSEFIVILDADFAPRPDFLAETLPYMDDPVAGPSSRPPSSSGAAPGSPGSKRSAGSVQEGVLPGSSRSAGIESVRRGLRRHGPVL